jgi:hypothetical protein
MDPFIESQEWSDFHGRLNAQIADELQERLRPTYVVRIERRVYVENPREEGFEPQVRIADVALTPANVAGPRHPSSADSVATLEPVACEMAVSEEQRETYLEIRDVEHRRVITVIETLSPANKRENGDGWHEYLKKRNQVLHSRSHFVELDLLRGGARMPIVPRPQRPVGDYRAMVSRANRRPRVAVYAWPLLHPLPKIAIPLIAPDEQIDLDLQRVFQTVYDRAAYELSLDYTADLAPLLPDEIKSWLQEQRRPA